MSDANASRNASWANLFRVSLRELLILIALAALSIVSFKYASDNWRTFVYVITMAFFMWAAVVATIDRGERQAFAIGMVLLMAIYALTLYFGTSELSLGGQLPTTKFAGFLYRPAERTYWYDRQTRQEVPNFDPTKAPPGSRTVQQRQTTPPPHVAMAVAHCWWALLLGYVGARFARVVYLRRNR